MSLADSFYQNKICNYNKARLHPASEKFYLTQEEVWELAYYEVVEESKALIEVLEGMDADNKVIDVVKCRLLGGVEE